MYTNNIERQQLKQFADKAKKSLTIKYISCSKDDKFIHLRFEATAQNLKENKAVVYVDELDNLVNDTAVPKTDVTISASGAVGIMLKFDKNKDFTETFYDDGNVFQATITCDGLSAKSEKFKLSFGKNTKDEQNVCYCLKQELTKTSCKGKGKNIVEEMYVNLANSIGVEKEILLAIAKQESGHESFVKNNPKRANILLERHYVYRLLKQKYGKQKADSCKYIDSSLCHEDPTPKGQYGTRIEQLNRLEKVKKWDETIAIESCSWGKFQTMGEYIEEDKGKIYKDSKDFEMAMNMCEVQHFKYFIFFLEKIKGKSLINAMKNKSWESIAYYYNGSHWKTTNPNYATNIKMYYEEFKNR